MKAGKQRYFARFKFLNPPILQGICAQRLKSNKMSSSVDELIIVANIVTEPLQSVAKVKRTVTGPIRPIVA